MEFTSVKNLPLKSWRQRRWFLLSAISMFPMLQRETDPAHFLLKLLHDNLSTASPAGSLKQPGPDPLWSNMLTPLVAMSKM